MQYRKNCCFSSVVVVEKASTILYLLTLVPFMIFALVGFSVNKFDVINLLRTMKLTVSPV
jgi:hypothetical protein